MPLARLYLTDEAYETFRQEARESTPRRTINRYLNGRIAMYSSPYSTYYPALDTDYLTSIGIDIRTITREALIKILTQGGGNHGIPGGAKLAMDPRRRRVLNLTDRTLIYLATLSDLLHIPVHRPGDGAKAAWALEFIARDWIIFKRAPRQAGTSDEL